MRSVTDWRCETDEETEARSEARVREIVGWCMRSSGRESGYRWLRSRFKPCKHEVVNRRAVLEACTFSKISSKEQMRKDRRGVYLFPMNQHRPPSSHYIFMNSSSAQRSLNKLVLLLPAFMIPSSQFLLLVTVEQPSWGGVPLQSRVLACVSATRQRVDRTSPE